MTVIQHWEAKIQKSEGHDPKQANLNLTLALFEDRGWTKGPAAQLPAGSKTILTLTIQ